MHDEPPRPLESPPTPAPPSPPRRIASSELFGGAREIVIEHGGRLYRMRITQNDKLILTA
jgi:hemin uptake protein HemP